MGPGTSTTPWARGPCEPGREAIKGYLDGGKSTVLDPDGNGTADALSDGILILRYLFDPTGAWNVNDALGTGATRTTREAIKAYLDQFNPSLSPPPGLMARGLTEEPTTPLPAAHPLPRSQAVSVSSSTFAVSPTEPVTSDVEETAQADADQLRAAIGHAVVIGGTSRTNFTVADQKSMPEKGSQPHDLRAVDTALESWDRPTGCGASTRFVADEEEIAPVSNGEVGDQLQSEGDLDWFLTQLDDVINDREADEIFARI